MKNDISQDDLIVFLTVLEEGGFRAAARRLGVAPSNVSTTVARIEIQLGVPLLLRTTRSMRATDQGRALAERIAPLMAEVRAACAETAGSAGHVSGRLKINAPGAVMPDILPPILAAFQHRHPAVVVEIVVDNGMVDIVASDCDAGIRYGASLEKDMISIPIGPRRQQIALAASPAYVEAHGFTETPAQLTTHDAIRYRLPGGPLLPWTLQNGGQAITVEPVTRLVLSVNALNSGLSYARAGMGIIAMFRNWLEDDFRAQTLVPILNDHWQPLDGPRLYYPNRFTSNALRTFIETCQSKASWVE
ncbi:LysR family transcriptional regulator [Pseudorhodobacter wandonensis]|uniref:LysR family transcriptional regulator n=1 Tax=Pseudorhodobacter wandonensis TaxID=1120568 RepID=UPI00067C4FCA|nr:LysR family transcriptional regulator [Pseudorhodobacter wandonensis]